MDSALLSGVSGLQAHQQMLDVVGNDLANINTTAFKNQTIAFEAAFAQTLRPASGPDTGQGGTNPLQIGSGVAVAGVRTNLNQGTLNATGNNLDLALQGNGFFIVNDGFQNLYTRDGSFGVDSNNTLVNPSTGLKVQRFGTVGEASATSPGFQTSGDMSIHIPYGTALPAKATSTVNLTGNLSATATGPLAQTLTSAQAFTAGGTAATSATALNSLDGRSSAYQTGDTIQITGRDTNGNAVNTSLAVDGTTTLGGLLAQINGAFTGATASLDSQGNLVMKANQTGPNSLSLTLADASTNVGNSNFGNHALNTAVTGKNGDQANASIQVFDTEGNAHTLALTFTKQANNLWNLNASLNPKDGTVLNGQVTGLQFNNDGSFQQVGSSGGGAPTITFQINGLSAPQAVTLNLGTAGGFGGLTQFGGASTAAATSQNGYAAGFLSNVAIQQDGTIQGVFTNGQTLAIAQVAVASFTNPAGLHQEANNNYSISANSGLATVGAAGAGGRGTVVQGELEASNVDPALELTQLITAQRGFEVNARTITAENQVLQTLATLVQ